MSAGWRLEEEFQGRFRGGMSVGGSRRGVQRGIKMSARREFLN